MKHVETSTQPLAWLTPRQAAEYLGVGVDIIYDGCAAGGLKHMRLGHRTIRLRREMARCLGGAHTRTSR